MNENSVITKTDYLAGVFQYKDNYLKFFPHPEGYVNVVDSHGINNYNYVFNYTDHLGNIRVSYGVDPDTQTLKILEENHYYPFGLKHEGYNMDYKTYQQILEESIKIKMASPVDAVYKYKYNGKELQTELGLDLYDYGARNYDPAIGRWMNVDPLAENSRRWTPYNYAYNNPIYFIDPDGMQSEGNDWIRNGDGTYTAQAGDSASTLARDAGITIERAKEVMANTYKSNSEGNNMGTYTDADGVEKSKVDVGDTVAIPEQVNAIVQDTKSQKELNESIEATESVIAQTENNITKLQAQNDSLEGVIEGVLPKKSLKPLPIGPVGKYAKGQQAIMDGIKFREAGKSEDKINENKGKIDSMKRFNQFRERVLKKAKSRVNN
ncbi:RHS repeat domain-containing protein [Flavobacterium sp. HNIBRBA15423]|uniref:RHS repeat domain-containing protein n=1 Tax=Flavobacterium sp. HNIBRBA15423 TaxID=3458683 RepID=UPI0040445BBF